MNEGKTAALSILALGAVLGSAACSSSSSTPSADGGSHDSAPPKVDSGKPDHHVADSAAKDAGKPDATAAETGTRDSGQGDTALDKDVHVSDAGRPADAKPDAYPTCSVSWLTPPGLDAGRILDLPADAGVLNVVLHGAGVGSQNYTCELEDGGVYKWVFVGPEARLDDCNGTFIIEHTASDAGPTRPQWASQIDNSVVIGKKIEVFDASASSIPWLLLQAVGESGSGLLTNVKFIQRLETDGGNAPAAANCSASTVNTTQDVGYSAQYFFYAP